MKFIGHRGFRHRHPENTLPAFEAVCAHPRNGRSVVGIELDIHLTADERIVVMHDTVVDDEQGKRVRVSALAFERVRRLNELARGCAAPPTPDLPEVLELVAHRTGLYLEVKEGGYDMDRFAGVLTGLLEGYDPSGDVFISSFSPRVLRRLTPVAARLGLELGFIFRSWEQWKGLPRDVHEVLGTLHPDYRLCLSAAGHVTELDRPLIPWSPNAPSAIEALLKQPRAESIRAIITDDIDLSERFPEP